MFGWLAALSYRGRGWGDPLSSLCEIKILVAERLMWDKLCNSHGENVESILTSQDERHQEPPLKKEEAELRESTATSRVAYEGVVAQLDTRKKRMQESDEEIAGGWMLQALLEIVVGYSRLLGGCNDRQGGGWVQEALLRQLWLDTAGSWGNGGGWRLRALLATAVPSRRLIPTGCPSKAIPASQGCLACDNKAAKTIWEA
eukprot:1160280-Pelagomonas_calceolata.AAC.1